MNNDVHVLRKEKHWSQDALAARVGVSRQCINAIEEGRFMPSIALAYNISIVLERSVLEVFPPLANPPGRSLGTLTGRTARKGAGTLM
jgi:putative transcriptional regulator